MLISFSVFEGQVSSTSMWETCSCINMFPNMLEQEHVTCRHWFHLCRDGCTKILSQKVLNGSVPVSPHVMHQPQVKVEKLS